MFSIYEIIYILTAFSNFAFPQVFFDNNLSCCLSVYLLLTLQSLMQFHDANAHYLVLGF